MGRVLPRLRAATISLLPVAAITFAYFRWFPVNATTVALSYLLVILLISAWGRLADAIVASVGAVLCFNYFFLPPIRTFAVADPQNWVALAVFFTVAFTVSKLSADFRHQRDELVASQREIEKLYALSRSMLLNEDAAEVRRLIVNKVVELFGFADVVLFERASMHFHKSSSTSVVSEDKMRQVALYGTVEHDQAAGVTIIPITLGGTHLGSLAFAGASLPEASLQALGNNIAIGLAQAHAREAGNRAEAVRKSEELKSVLIDALAHDLKTPLTSMEAAVDMLLQPALVSPQQQHELLEVIQHETRGLKKMMGEAIHLSRVDAKRLKLEWEPMGVRTLVGAALESLGDRVDSHRVSIEMPAGLTPVSVDSELAVQALKQLIDNAMKYSPASSVVTISAAESEGVVSISVRDHGQGLTELEQRHVFEKFYRGKNDQSAIQGTGMGLSIAKEIIEAHGGSIRVESQLGQGSLFTIMLHAAPAPEPQAV